MRQKRRNLNPSSGSLKQTALHCLASVGTAVAAADGQRKLTHCR